MEFKGENLSKALNKFGKKTVEVAAANLLRSKRGYDTGKLLKSIDYDVAVTLNAFSLKFNYEDYGEQIDKGRGCFGGCMRPQKSAVLPLLQGWMLIVRREGSENQEV